MSKGEHLIVYIIEFILGLVIMNFLLMVSPLISIIFFVVYINIVRENHRKRYRRDNPGEQRVTDYHGTTQSDSDFVGYNPYSEEEKKKRRSNYHDD